MRNDLHHLHLLLFGRLLKDTMADHPHFRILLPLLLGLHPKLAIPHVILVGFNRRLGLLIHDFQRRIPLRKLERLLVIETQPGVMIRDPSWKFASIVVVIDYIGRRML